MNNETDGWKNAASKNLPRFVPDSHRSLAAEFTYGRTQVYQGATMQVITYG